MRNTTSLIRNVVVPGFIALSTLVGIRPASATVVDVTYVTSTGTLALKLDGTLLADGNTFTVADVISTFVDQVVQPATPNIASPDALYGYNVFAVPTITLDGSYMDFFAQTSDFDAYFAFAVGDIYATQNPAGYLQSEGFGHYGDFDVILYSATVESTETTTDIPEPGALALLILPAAMLCASRAHSIRRTAA